MPPNSFFREIKLKTLCQDYLPEVHLREVFMGCLRPSMNPQISSVNVCGPWASETLGKAMTPRTHTLPLVLQTRSGHKQAEPTHGLRLGSCPTPQRAESLDPPYHSPTRRGFPCTTLSHTGVAWAEQCGGEEVMWNVTRYSLWGLLRDWGGSLFKGDLCFCFLRNCFTFIYVSFSSYSEII